MRYLIALLLLAIALVHADENVKHPWYTDFYGNQIFSNFQLNEQLDIPDEFGQLDTTKQDFMMRLSSENIKSLYYSRGYFSLDMKMEIRREFFSIDSMQRGYLFTINEGDRYKFDGVEITGSTQSDVEIKMTSLSTNNKGYFEQEDIAEGDCRRSADIPGSKMDLCGIAQIGHEEGHGARQHEGDQQEKDAEQLEKVDPLAVLFLLHFSTALYPRP